MFKYFKSRKVVFFCHQNELSVSLFCLEDAQVGINCDEKSRKIQKMVKLLNDMALHKNRCRYLDHLVKMLE